MAPVQELWRLHRTGVVAYCRLTFTGTEYALTITHGDDVLTFEHHSDFRGAYQSADLSRRKHLADGWSGVFPRQS